MKRLTNKEKFFPTAEQSKILHDEFKNGFKSAREGPELDRVVNKTGCPKSYVKDWIYNRSKTNRGTAYKVKSTKPYTIYTAFLALTCPEFDGSRVGMSEMVKKRVAEYRKLKSTAKGLKFLHENCDRMNAARHTEPATRKRAHNQALGYFTIMRKAGHKLEKLGYKSTTLVSQPLRGPAIFGADEALAYFKDKQELVEDFGEKVAIDKGKAQDDKATCRRKVQKTFNTLFAKASGRPKARVPYQAIQEKKIQVCVRGLPEGIIFQSTKNYTIADLDRIYACKESISLDIISGTESIDNILDAESDHGDHDLDAASDSAQPDERESPNTNSSLQQDKDDDDWSDDDDLPLVQLHEVVLANNSTQPDKRESPNTNRSLQQDNNDDAWSDNDDLPLVQLHEVVLANESAAKADSTQSTTNVLREDEPPMPTFEESIGKAMLLVRKEEQQRARDNGSLEISAKRAKKTDGQRIMQEFIVSKGRKPDKRQWYEGTVIKQTTENIVIRYDPPSKEVCKFPKHMIETYENDGTFIYI